MFKIYNTDCLGSDGLLGVGANTIDLVITSPPYKDEDNYSEDLMRGVFRNCFRVLKRDSLFFLNFGHLAEDKFRPFRVCQLAMEAGFKLNDTITWVKRQYRPLQGNKRLNNLSEFVFLLYKGKMPSIDREAIGIPHEDKSNVKRWGKDWKCRSNVWVVGYETIQKKEDKLHNDRFPLELPELCVKLSGLKQGMVLDPFMGSGTAGLAAMNLGLNFTGFEINKHNYEVARKRLLS